MWFLEGVRIHKALCKLGPYAYSSHGRYCDLYREAVKPPCKAGTLPCCPWVSKVLLLPRAKKMLLFPLLLWMSLRGRAAGLRITWCGHVYVTIYRGNNLECLSLASRFVSLFTICG